MLWHGRIVTPVSGLRHAVIGVEGSGIAASRNTVSRRVPASQPARWKCLLRAAGVIVQLLEHVLEREAARLLAGREVAIGREVLGDVSLCRHQRERVLDAPPRVVARIRLRTLE